MDPDNVTNFTALGTIIAIVLYLLKVQLPEMQRQHREMLEQLQTRHLQAMEQKRQDDFGELSRVRDFFGAQSAAERSDFLAALNQAREDSRASLTAARTDFLAAVREREEQHLRQMEAERVAWERHTDTERQAHGREVDQLAREVDQLAKSIKELADVVIFHGTETRRATGPGLE
jgi:hypothetical protein